jgi:hypothetical protein
MYRGRSSPNFTQRDQFERLRGEIGKFEREFDVVDDLGVGEFGKVMKVKRRTGVKADEFALKRSKRFEGVKHRYRSNRKGHCRTTNVYPKESLFRRGAHPKAHFGAGAAPKYFDSFGQLGTRRMLVHSG